MENITTYKEKHIRFLDGIRCLGFLLVFLFHLSNSLEIQPQPTLLGNSIIPVIFSDFGLHLFFVLSGYLHFKPFVTSVESNKDFPDIKKYLIRRFFRIYPAYLFFILLVLVSSFLSFYQANHSPNLFLILSHVFLFHTFFDQTIWGLVGPWWAVALEVHFYIFLALSMVLLQRFQGRKLTSSTLFWFVSISLIASELFRIGFNFLNAVLLRFSQFNYINPDTILLPDRSLFGQLCTFACGMLLALILHSDKYRNICKLKASDTTLVLGFIGLFVTNASVIFAPPIHFYGNDLLLSICWTVILYCCLSNRQSRIIQFINSVLSTKLFVYIGTISYSCYLSHQIVINVLRKHIFVLPTYNFGLFFAISLSTVMATVLLSTVTYNFIEKPFLSLSAKFR